MLPEDPLWEDGGEADDEGEAESAVEKSRREKEEEKWATMAAKEKVEEVKLVEVPFFVPLSSKAAPEVLAATKEILLQVRRLGLVVRRVHTDCGREFVNKAFRALCADRDMVKTTTGGDNFRSNGRVEALVGRAKNAVRTLLSASTLGPEAWSFAMRHYVARVQWSVVTQLGGRYPRLPPFGTKVFVKKRSWQMKKEEFVEKVVAARILCPSCDVARGFLVKTADGGYLTTMVAVENVKEVSRRCRANSRWMLSQQLEQSQEPVIVFGARRPWPLLNWLRSGRRSTRASWIPKKRSILFRTRSSQRPFWKQAISRPLPSTTYWMACGLANFRCPTGAPRPLIIVRRSQLMWRECFAMEEWWVQPIWHASDLL